MVLGASKSIQCSTGIKDNIYYKLDPPFEELFDEAEEYVLSILFDAWTQMLSTDITTFSKVSVLLESLSFICLENPKYSDQSGYKCFIYCRS